MTFNRLARRAILEWQNWLSRRRLHAAYPELAEIAKRRNECRKSHKRGAAALDRQARELMSAALRGGA
jgi:hypothetical protein